MCGRMDWGEVSCVMHTCIGMECAQTTNRIVLYEALQDESKVVPTTLS